MNRTERGGRPLQWPGVTEENPAICCTICAVSFGAEETEWFSPSRAQCCSPANLTLGNPCEEQRCHPPSCLRVFNRLVVHNTWRLIPVSHFSQFKKFRIREHQPLMCVPFLLPTFEWKGRNSQNWVRLLRYWRSPQPRTFYSLTAGNKNTMENGLACISNRFFCKRK